MIRLAIDSYIKKINEVEAYHLNHKFDKQSDYINYREKIDSFIEIHKNLSNIITTELNAVKNKLERGIKDIS